MKYEDIAELADIDPKESLEFEIDDGKSILRIGPETLSKYNKRSTRYIQENSFEYNSDEPNPPKRSAERNAQSAISASIYDTVWIDRQLTQRDIATDLIHDTHLRDFEKEKDLKHALRGMELLDDYGQAYSEFTDSESLLSETGQRAVKNYVKEIPGAHPEDAAAAIVAEIKGIDNEPIAEAFGRNAERVGSIRKNVDSMLEEAEEQLKKEKASRNQLERLGIDPESVETFH